MASLSSFSVDMLAITTQMLVAAEKNDWNTLLDLENQRTQMIEAVKVESLNGAVLIDEISIRKIQDADEKTMRLVMNRMTEINDIFNVSPIGRRLSRLYSDMIV